MRILVDADACPVKEIIVEVAKKYNLEVIMFFDTSHIYEDGYSKVITVDKGLDSVDFKLMNELNNGDIVVSQDYGVASMALGKEAIALDQNGREYTQDNIVLLLELRHQAAIARKSGKRTKGPKKRTHEQDKSFEIALKRLVSM